MNFPPALNAQVFLDAANLMAAWKASNTDENGKVIECGVYTAHCALRAIARSVKGRKYLIHYHRAFFSYLFSPEYKDATRPYWNEDYEARILALCFASTLCQK